MSEDVGTTDGGASADSGTGAPDTNLTGGQFNFREHLNPELANHSSMADIKDINGLAKSYISGQELVGKQRLPLPPADADSETMGKFYDSIGRPAGTADNGYGYDFSKTGDMPEGVNKDDKAEGYWHEKMHARGLTQAQAEGLYQDQISFTEQMVNGGKEKQASLEKEWDQSLRQDMGLAYKEQMEAANMAIDTYGTDELRAYFNDSRVGNHPEMIKFAAKIGTTLMESGSMGEGGRKAGNQMTPEQAKTEISNLQRNSGFMTDYNSQTPQHAEAVATMQRLHDAAYPETAEQCSGSS